MLDDSAADLLALILAAGHGLMIVGDSGAGKTTLLGALLSQLSSVAASNIVVERVLLNCKFPIRLNALP